MSHAVVIQFIYEQSHKLAFLPTRPSLRSTLGHGLLNLEGNSRKEKTTSNCQTPLLWNSGDLNRDGEYIKPLGGERAVTRTGSEMLHSSLSYFLICLSSLASTALSECVNGKDQTGFVKNMINKIAAEDSKGVRLPRRLLGDVYLKKGFIRGLETVKLMEEPVLLICHNQTLGAVQPKLVLENVTFVYEWVYGDDESWGTAATPSQKVYIDIDIEQTGEAEKPTMLGLYITKITNTKFQVEVNGSKGHSDVFDHKYQVALVTRTFIARDAGLAITMEVSPKVNDYLFYNKLPIS